MTTDLSGNFELGEEEFDWDVFLPDPDEAQLAAEAAALEDEAELDVDDSEFDWEAALRDEGEPENEAEDGARAGAAYDRIVDTVRRSVEEPATEAETDPDAETEPEAGPVAVEETMTIAAAALEADAQAIADGSALVAEPEPAQDHLVDFEPEYVLEPDDMPVPAWPIELEADGLITEPEPQPDTRFGTGPELEPALGNEEPEVEHFSTLEETAATAAAVWTIEPVPSAPSDPAPTWATPSADPGEDAGEVESVADPIDAGADDDADHDHADGADGDVADGDAADGDDGAGVGERQRRSRVFTATVVLACLFLVVVAAGLAVRALHHPTTPSPTAPPAHAAPPVTPSPSSSTARIQTATDAVDSATTAASVGLTSLAAFPTPENVETVINPYIASLQLYGTVLAGSQIPVAARPAAASAESQLRQDLRFLDTIDGLPASQLGAFLVQFDADATRLQTTLSTLEQNLRAPGS